MLWFGIRVVKNRVVLKEQTGTSGGYSYNAVSPGSGYTVWMRRGVDVVRLEAV